MIHSPQPPSLTETSFFCKKGPQRAIPMPMDKSIIFFDGQCNLCNGTVDFIIARDHRRIFHYCSLQSPQAQKLLAPHPQLAGEESLLLWHRGRLSHKSTAALLICSELSGGLRWLSSTARLIPRPARDWVYALIARHRYRLWGQSTSCRLPQAHEKKYFIC